MLTSGLSGPSTSQGRLAMPEKVFPEKSVTYQAGVEIENRSCGCLNDEGGLVYSAWDCLATYKLPTLFDCSCSDLHPCSMSRSRPPGLYTRGCAFGTSRGQGRRQSCQL
jgi:hypothetical protein